MFQSCFDATSHLRKSITLWQNIVGKVYTSRSCIPREEHSLNLESLMEYAFQSGKSFSEVEMKMRDIGSPYIFKIIPFDPKKEQHVINSYFDAFDRRTGERLLPKYKITGLIYTEDKTIEELFPLDNLLDEHYRNLSESGYHLEKRMCIFTDCVRNDNYINNNLNKP